MMKLSETGQRPGSQNGKMNVTAKEVVAVLKDQIAKSQQALAKTGYDEAPVRARCVVAQEIIKL